METKWIFKVTMLPINSARKSRFGNTMITIHPVPVKMDQHLLTHTLGTKGKVMFVMKEKFSEGHMYPVRSGVLQTKLQLIEGIPSSIVV